MQFQILKERKFITKGIEESLGQLYVIRALAYYDLTVVWGDVPFFTEILSPEELSSSKEHQLRQLEML